MSHAPSDLTWRIGGPLGTHARRGGIWFNAVLWTILGAVAVWAGLLARQAPCRQRVYGQPVNPFVRLCYSDIPLLYQGRGVATGAGIYSQVPLEYPVLTGYFIMVGRFLTRVFGGVVGPQATGQQQLDASYRFFAICAIGLFVCFLGTVLIHLALGRNRRSGWTPGMQPGSDRSWDAWMIACAPVVLASGLINFDLLAVLLTSLGLWAWARRWPIASGALIGLAFAAKFYPILLVPALLLVCLRADRMTQFLRWLAAGAGAWFVVNVPMMVTAWQGWTAFWVTNLDRGPDLGSLWYVLNLMGFPVGSVTLVSLACMVLGAVAVSLVVLRAPRRPRLAQVALLFLLVFLVFNKVYSPQYSLWLLPLVVLARPKVLDWAVWNLTEVLYWAAVWGFLEGILGIGSGADVLYWLATFARIGVQIWLALRVIDDIRYPWDDPVRTPFVDDPIGGVLDHAPDAAWLLRRPARPASGTPGSGASPSTGSTSGTLGSEPVGGAPLEKPMPREPLLAPTPGPRQLPDDPDPSPGPRQRPRRAADPAPDERTWVDWT